MFNCNNYKRNAVKVKLNMLNNLTNEMRGVWKFRKRSSAL